MFDRAVTVCKQLKRCAGSSPGEHVARLLHLIAWHMVLHIWLVHPRLDVHNLLAVVVRHRRAVNLIWRQNQGWVSAHGK